MSEVLVNNNQFRLRRLIAPLAVAGSLLVGACSDDRGEARPSTTTTTVAEAEKPQEKYTGVATERLKNDTLPKFVALFEALRNDDACVGVSIEERGGSYNGDTSIMFEEIIASKGDTTLEISMSYDANTGEVKRIFGRTFVPGDALTAEERANNASSDNPEGNKYLISAELFDVLTEQGKRIDAVGSDAEGPFSTQGDIEGFNEFFLEMYGMPLEGAKRADAVVDQLIDFVGETACISPPDDPNVV